MKGSWLRGVFPCSSDGCMTAYLLNSLRQKLSSSHSCNRPNCNQAASPVPVAQRTLPKTGQAGCLTDFNQAGHATPFASMPAGHAWQPSPTAEIAATKMLRTRTPTVNGRDSNEPCMNVAKSAQAQCTVKACEPALPRSEVATSTQGAPGAGKIGTFDSSSLSEPKAMCTPRLSRVIEPVVTRKLPSIGASVESTALRHSV
mmetsp:Transcript_36318/g.104356  ORF Transcript_36318/g.104356 Transcript_36318/m.104356 type:complete len:201 (-) Transcript_36318:795-1397(-)